MKLPARLALRWPWQPRPAAPVETGLAFDALVDAPGTSRTAGLVQSRVMALPGAGWISVEPGPAIAVTLFQRGSSIEGAGPEWDALRRQVREVVLEAMAAAAAQPAWSEPAPLVAGFAEPAPDGLGEAALSPALAQLAALAAMQHVPRPAPAPLPPPLQVPVQVPAASPGDPETARLARLLAMVLPADPAEPAAAAVRRFGSYAAVLAAPEAELRRIQGLGTHCIAAIKLVHAAAIRLARAGIAAQPVLEQREQLADYLAAALARERIEQFRILFLDARGMLQADEIQARGTVNHTPVYPREVVRRALALGAASLILVHNHPSGDPTPSREDIDMTAQVRDAAAVMKILLRDHVIIGNGRWLSFRDEGLLR